MTAVTQVLSGKEIEQKIDRITRQIIENNFREKNIIIAGINGNGFLIAQKIHKIIAEHGLINASLTEITIQKTAPSDANTALNMDESLVKERVVLVIDDVINSGKTMSFAVRYILGLGAKSIQTAVLVDRKHRTFPISSNYMGVQLSTTLQDRVDVQVSGNEMIAYLK